MLVDVVVRDRRGQPVRDLTQADFEILEDGVAQTIGSFTPVLRAQPVRAAGRARGAARNARTGCAPDGAARRAPARCDGARLRSPEPRSAASGRPGGAELSGNQGGNGRITSASSASTSALDAVRAVHAERRVLRQALDSMVTSAARSASAAPEQQPADASAMPSRQAAQRGAADGRCDGGRRPGASSAMWHCAGALRSSRRWSRP